MIRSHHLRRMKPSIVALCCLLTFAPTLGGCDDVSTFLAGESPSMALANATWSGETSGATAASFVTARTAEEWNAIWATIGKPPPAALPSGHMAVAVFLGEQLQTHPQVEILSAEVVRPPGGIERASVIYRVTTPPVSATETDAASASIGAPASPPSSPWAVRIMDRAVADPTFQQAG